MRLSESTCALALLIALAPFVDGRAGFTRRGEPAHGDLTGRELAQDQDEPRGRSRPGGRRANPITPDRPREANPEVTPSPGAGDPEAFTGDVITLHVDRNHARASDENPGSADEPLATVNRAFAIITEQASRNQFFDLKIHAGVYREEVEISLPMNRNIHLLIEGIGDAVISGSELYTRWRPAGDGRYVHDWPHDWGLVTETEAYRERADEMVEKHRNWIENTGDLFKRREMVVFNGEVLDQVLAEKQLAAGTYFVDEDGDRLVMIPPAGASMEGATVEVPVAFRVLLIRQTENVTLRNLTVQHAASTLGFGGAAIKDCRNVLIEDCTFIQGNHRGLDVHGTTNVTLRRVTASDNGAQGMDVSWITNLLMEDCVTDGNNWRGDRADVYSWAIAGAKILYVNQGIVRRHQANDNLTRGIWFDLGNYQVVLENSTMNRNKLDGLMCEATQGPMLVRDCEIRDNLIGGVRIANADRIMLEDNVIAGNGKVQIYVYGYNRHWTNRRTGEEVVFRNRYITLLGNQIRAETAEQLLFWTNTPPREMGPFLETIESDGNTWVHPDPAHAFMLKGTNERFGYRKWAEQVGEGPDSRVIDSSH